MVTKGFARSVTIVVLVAACVSVSGLASAQAPSGVKFTTISPTGGYETLGVILAVGRVSPGILDPNAPFRETLREITPELESQAKARAANMVVITSISLLPAGGSSLWMVVYGTAIRTGSTGAHGAVMGSAPVAQGGSAVASAAPASVGDPAGTWHGELVEAGGKEPLKVTLNLAGTVTPGEIAGGYVLEKSQCEYPLTYEGQEGNLTFFKTVSKSKLTCPNHIEVSVELLSSGMLDMKVYTSKRATIRCQGQLSRG